MQEKLKQEQHEFQLRMKGKKQKNEGLSGLPKFLIYLFFGIPSLIGFNLPFLLLNIIWNKIKNIFIKQKKPIRLYPQFNFKREPLEIKFDIVLYGASGFTGQLCSKYLSKNYDKLNWAIAGRSLKKLKEVNDMLDKPMPILIADSEDIEALQIIIKSAKVIINTAGPFDLYATNIVALCASYGTHYVDITGEVAWVRQMIEQYDQQAVQSGARIISCCGLDSIPWDLVTLRANNDMLRLHNQKLVQISFFDKMCGEFSGGTFATLLHSLANPPPKSQLGFDPLIKNIGDNQKIQKQFKSKNQKLLTYSSQVRKWVGAWALADANASIVKRSQALSDSYSNSLFYTECMIFPNFIAGFNFYMSIILEASLLGNSWFRDCYYKCFIAQPGQGPSKQQMNDGFMIIEAYCYGENGAKIKETIGFYDDPGYRDTARLVCEAGLTMHFEEQKIKVKGGFWTPAAGLGELLTTRLLESGSTLTLEQIN